MFDRSLHHIVPAFNGARAFENPRFRVPIRADFPKIINPYNFRDVAINIRDELEKRGLRFEDIEQINLSFPHKEGSRHNNGAQSARILTDNLGDLLPQKRWVMARGIFDAAHLGRSENQSAVHALTERHVYGVDMEKQQRELPFLRENFQGESYFILVDDCFEQGTTLANLHSFIEHNGGTVLGAYAAPVGLYSSLQQRGSSQNFYGLGAPVESDVLSAAFNDASYGAGRIPEMATAFQHSARQGSAPWRDMDAAACAQMFEDCLAPFDHSMTLMTDGEAQRLIDTLMGAYKEKLTFDELISDLHARAHCLEKERSAASKDHHAHLCVP